MTSLKKLETCDSGAETFRIKREEMALAEKMCTASAIDQQSCRWYHSSWPILRMLNLVSTPTWHGNFYREALSRYAKDVSGPLHILLSASADAAMFEHIERSLKDMSRVHIWFIDLCPTPLEIGRRWAKSKGFSLHTAQMDALHLAHEGLPQNFFDIVTTDAFLTRFEKASDKKRIVREWYGALKNGGQVITTCRISNKKKEAGNISDQYSFVNKAQHLFARYVTRNQCMLRPRDTELVRLSASRYAQCITSYPVSEDKLREIFVKNNFSIATRGSRKLIPTKKVRGEFKPTTYAHIVATKIRK